MTAATARVTIGLTESDRTRDYYPSSDGYLPGARQMKVHVDVPTDLLAGLRPEDIAEACFTATNMPQEAIRYESLTGFIARAVLPARELAQIGDMRSMSVGDTVTFGDTALACAPSGWTAL